MPVDLTLRQDGAIRVGAAQIHAQEIAVQALARGVDGNDIAVTLDADIARAHARYQRRRVLIIHHAHVQAALGVEDARVGRDRGGVEGVGLDDAHAIDDGQRLPDRLIEIAIEGDVDLRGGKARQRRQGFGRAGGHCNNAKATSAKDGEAGGLAHR